MHKDWLAATSASVVTADRKVPRLRLPGRALLLAVSLLAGPVSTLRAEGVTELIEQARQCDPSYTIGPQVSRSQAMELYEKALTAGITDPRQQLDVLFRMGQLSGSILDRAQGEKPNFRKAIGFYQRIVESYPPEEPMVITAMGLISDHYTSLREPEAALAWAQRTLAQDSARIQGAIKTIEQQLDSLAQRQYTPAERRAILDQRRRRVALQDSVRRIEKDRVTAVDRIAHASELIDPLRAYGELQRIADKYSGTPVGDRALQRLRENMDRSPELWAPRVGPPPSPAAAWRPASGAAVLLTRDYNEVEAPSRPSLETPTGPSSPEPGTTEEPRAAVPLTESPRAPPLALLAAGIVAAASLIIFGLAARRMRKHRTSLRISP
jgi:hypothetical protein